MKTRHLTVAAATLAVLAGLGGGPAAVADGAGTARATPMAAPLADPETADKGRPGFRVKPGTTLTSPLDGSGRAINNKITRIVNHVGKGEIIRMASWNFDSWPYVSALTAAHNRGASVRLIMARTLANDQSSSGPYATLRRNLQQGNKSRGPAMRSWFRTCDHSCRGKGGAMHSKFYVFSRAGRSHKVVMNTSANLTSAAARVQWNEAFTTVGRGVTYRNYLKVFTEMSRDRPAPYHQFRDGNITGYFYPRPGRSDLVMDMLNAVTCKGARGAGINGKTAIRVGQDVFNNTRGTIIARKLRELHRKDCNVRVVYSQAVGDSREIIQSIPHNHLVQDQDGDGAYDIYLHGKVLAISGHYGNDRGTRIVMNGSGNWSATALQSDEQGMIIRRDNAERAYSAWINKMFTTRLVSAKPIPGLRTADPYSQMES